MRARLNVPNHNYRLQAQEAWTAFCNAVTPPPIEFEGVNVVHDELACDGLPANAIASAEIVAARPASPAYARLCLPRAFFDNSADERTLVLLHETAHLRLYQGRLTENYRMIQELQLQRIRGGEPAAGFIADRADFAAELLGFAQEVGVDKFIPANYPQLRDAYLRLRLPFFVSANRGVGAGTPELAVYHLIYRLLRAQLGLLVVSTDAARKEIKALLKQYEKQLCDDAKADLPWINSVRRVLLDIRVDTDEADPQSYSELFGRVMATHEAA